MKIAEFIKYSQAKAIGTGNQSIETEIEELAYDTRKVQTPAKCLFIALTGHYRNGHDFIEDAYLLGIRYFLISENIATEKFPDAVFLKVENTILAIQNIARQHRLQFSFPIIGITGSNGKTITKEWSFQLLADKYKIVRNPKSYNSQIGVPVSVWQIKKENNFGIFEAGISLPGEMELLEKIIQPTWGLFTNIGDAHSEGFLSEEQKIREKLNLFKHSDKLFYCADHAAVHQAVLKFKEENKGIELCSWSKKQSASLQITGIEKAKNKTTISGIFDQKNNKITIPFEDDASIENAIHCWNILLHLNIEPEYIAKKMAMLHAVSMRLERVHGINNTLLINDTYNSDLTSLQIAIEMLMRQKPYPVKTIILSDFLQVGGQEEKLYPKVAQWIAEKEIHRFIGVGTKMLQYKDVFEQKINGECLFYKSTEDFIKDFQHLHFAHEAILIKGARAFRFEEIERLLEQKIHRTLLEINLSSIKHNFKIYKNLLPPEVKVMAMVKAYSYGSGTHEIAFALQEVGVDYLGVAYLDEGISLRQAGITAPIMVMNPEQGGYDRMIQWKLEPEIYGMESLLHFQKVAKTLGIKKYPIHLMIDTGMHRLGFLKKDIPALKANLKTNSGVKVLSVFSHLSGSASEEFDDFTQQQINLFEETADEIAQVLPEKPMCHILNSNGITRHTKYHFDMVRLGVGLYGIDCSDQIQHLLEYAGTLKTAIAQIHELTIGEYVGYDLKAQVDRPSAIATVNIGYADGYPRALGNKGKSYMLVHGKKAPVIGSVCMDMCMLDVTDIPEAKAGDEVIVFGESPNLNQLASWADTIPYEIMSGISQRVNRIYVEE